MLTGLLGVSGAAFLCPAFVPDADPGRLARAAAKPTVAFRGKATATGCSLAAKAKASVEFTAKAKATTAFRAKGTLTVAAPNTYVEMYRGEDVTLDIVMDLAPPDGTTLTWTMAEAPGGAAVITKEAELVSARVYRVTLAWADTANLTARRYSWDCRRQPVGLKATVAEGELNLLREITP